ncbi:hypothetical protein ZEAMMB73_Zm00001d019615 [Zea mays]|uniref:Uncharacterized protein n=1 Tax=Zea mays TaxID=4577 RepID=A0A1D6HZA1_MAIZE|nr:hypothetical protein ZEAMMB73_Zm00001d019615 [Zea mays]
MALSRHTQNRTVAGLSPFPPFVLFDDIQDVNNLPQVKSVFARVVVKFPRRRNSQHYILQDITGSKIEAISNSNNVQRFDALLTQGCTYTLYRVAFCLNREELQFRNIGHGLELKLITHTIVDPFMKPIQFLPFPKYLMPFHEVYQQPHKTFVDVIGIVLHLEPLKHIGGRPYREAVLMDSSTIHFNPDHHTIYCLKTIRRSLIDNPRSRFIDKFLENRRAHLATVTSD